MGILNALAHFFGLDNGSGANYLWWSGIGSDLGEVAMIGAAWTLARKHNCHVKGCWRLGKHDLEGTPYCLCAKHHPDVPADGVNPIHIKTAHWKVRNGR